MIIGRTIPSFRIAAVLEEKEWKQYRKYLNNKKDKKVFNEMFSIAKLYNSACSYASIPIRIYPIMMSIVFHPDTNCPTWVLTYDGGYNIDKYIVEKTLFK